MLGHKIESIRNRQRYSDWAVSLRQPSLDQGKKKSPPPQPLQAEELVGSERQFRTKYCGHLLFVAGFSGLFSSNQAQGA
jgi:hypothetical protein